MTIDPLDFNDFFIEENNSFKSSLCAKTFEANIKSTLFFN